MGYFPNGTSAEIYMAALCVRCSHFVDGGCPVLDAHMLHNYDECNNDSSILDFFIPRVKDDVGNKECTMFHASNPDRCADTPDMFEGETA